MKKNILLVSLLFIVPSLFLFAGGAQEEESNSIPSVGITVEIRHCNT